MLFIRSIEDDSYVLDEFGKCFIGVRRLVI